MEELQIGTDDGKLSRIEVGMSTRRMVVRVILLDGREIGPDDPEFIEFAVPVSLIPARFDPRSHERGLNPMRNVAWKVDEAGRLIGRVLWAD